MDNNRAAIMKELVVIVVIVALLAAAAGFLIRNVVVAARSLDGTQTADDFSFDVGDIEKALRDLAAKYLPAENKKTPAVPAPPPAAPTKQPAAENRNAEVTSVRFFEAGKDVPQPQARRYAVQFGTQARYIYVEIGVKNNRYKIADATLQFAVQCLDAAGRKVDERKTTARAKKETASGFLALALDAAQAGGWRAGQYTVKVSVDGEYIGEYKFTIE